MPSPTTRIELVLDVVELTDLTNEQKLEAIAAIVGPFARMDLTAHIDAVAAPLRAAARDGYHADQIASAAVKVATRRDHKAVSAALYGSEC